MFSPRENLYVLKRNGTRQEVHFDKILTRIKRMVDGDEIGQPKLDNIDAASIAQNVIQALVPGIKTTDLDKHSADIAAYGASHNQNMSKLAARILISDLHKRTSPSFTKNMTYFYENNMINKESYDAMLQHGDKLDQLINHSLDYSFNFIGIKTLTRTYLLSRNGVSERPQHMLMREALNIHLDDFESLKETYLNVSMGYCTHATPTLINACTARPQMSSCFLLEMQDDSIAGIFKTVSQCAEISKYGGGIGLNINKVRATGSIIKGTNGISNGVGPMLRVFDATASYVDQGGGKRKGSFAMYMEPWHKDIFTFLDMKRDSGSEGLNTPDLFYGLWIPDLFMTRLISGKSMSLFSPSDVPKLLDTWGEEFEKAYHEYELDESIPRSTVGASEIWMAVLASQAETGVPYWMFKDTICRTSNQKHIGPIKCSNLCTEIVQYTSPEEIAVCNLASINLAKFVVDGKFDFDHLELVTKMLVRNLDLVVDRNFYPLPEARNSNMRHRPMAIGIQGLAFLYFELRLPFDSEAAEILNRKILEHMHLAAWEETCKIAESKGTYPAFKGSPASQGILQHDMHIDVVYSPELDERRQAVRTKLQRTGARNTYLIGLMPTAATSLLMNSSEAFDPLSANYFARKTGSGTFHDLNPYLVRDLTDIGLWSRKMFEKIVLANGSIQSIEAIPQEIRNLYKTVWEIPVTLHLKRAQQRQWFVDQAQSSSLYIPKGATTEYMVAILIKAWNMGLKTGCYYGRQRPISEPPKHGLDEDSANKEEEVVKTDEQESKKCRFTPGMKGDENCTMCGS